MKSPLPAATAVLSIFFAAETVWAASEAPVTQPNGEYEFSPMILAGLAAIRLTAKIAGELSGVWGSQCSESC